MTVLDHVKRTLGLHPAGREILEAAHSEETRVQRREAAFEQLPEVEAIEAEVDALLRDRDRAEEKLDDMEARAAEARRQVSQARRAVTEATQTASRLRRGIEATLRATAPHVIAENGPVIPWLVRQREHVGEHMALETEAVRWRQFLRDFKAAGEPVKDRTAARKARKELALHDSAAEIKPAFVEALEAVRELQLENMDPPALTARVREILADYIPARCACGAAFDTAEALPRDEALLSA